MRLVVGFSVLVLLGCTPPARPAAAPLARPALAYRTLTASAEFTPRELAGLAQAADLLARETQGRVDIKIDPGASWGQIRRHGPLDPEVVAADAYFGLPVYAWRDGALDVHMVPIRMRTDRAFVSVAMHEFLHVIGVQHVSGDPDAMMAASKDANNGPLTLTQTDRDAIAAALNCPTW